MARIDVNVAELRRFIGLYRVYANDIDIIRENMMNEVLNLEWNDGVMKRFDEKFTEAVKHLLKFRQSVEEDLKFLTDRLEKAERYLEKR